MLKSTYKMKDRYLFEEFILRVISIEHK